MPPPFEGISKYATKTDYELSVDKYYTLCMIIIDRIELEKLE